MHWWGDVLSVQHTSPAIWISIRNEWDLLTEQPSPNENLNPTISWFEEKGSLSKPFWDVANLVMVPKLLPVMIHHWTLDTPSALHGELPTTTRHQLVPGFWSTQGKTHVNVCIRLISCLNRGKSWVPTTQFAWKHQHSQKPTILEVFETLSIKPSCLPRYPQTKNNKKYNNNNSTTLT